VVFAALEDSRQPVARAAVEELGGSGGNVLKRLTRGNEIGEATEGVDLGQPPVDPGRDGQRWDEGQVRGRFTGPRSAGSARRIGHGRLG
jgi:hypothetical protein